MQTPQPPPTPIIVKGPVADVKPGTVIKGKYRVEREIGRGGFGVVVRAVHLTLHQVVAIKVLTEAEGHDADWAQDAARFSREAKATATLKGEHVVRVLDVDALESGAPFIVMEYLEGQTLHYVTHSRGPLPIAEAVDIAVQMLAALAEAHAVGIVHRDLKPANVFLAKGPSGGTVVKVLDFGVSKIDSSTTHALTRTGAVIGTVAYMAPEQMLDAKRVDGRADLWSVGQILYEALTKQLPFGPSSASTLVNAIVTMPPTPLSVLRRDIPPALDAILLRCFEKDAARRFQTAVEFGAALAPFASPAARVTLDYLFRSAPPSGAAAPGPNPPPRQSVHTYPPPQAPAPPPNIVPLVAAFAIAAVLLGLIALVIFLKSDRSAAPPRALGTPSASAAAPLASLSSSPTPSLTPSSLLPQPSVATATATTSGSTAPPQSTRKPRK
jgi:serine/threonine-protein kinase